MPNDGLITAIPGGGSAFFLYPRATSAQIGSGNVITTDATIEGVTSETPQPLGFVFETVPAIVSYEDTAGDHGTIEYPDTSGYGSCCVAGNAIKVAAGPNGDVEVTLTFYRPQRPGVAGAGEAQFMDIGHLAYTLRVQVPPKPGEIVPEDTAPCEPSDYSNLSPTLTLSTAKLMGVAHACVLVDSEGDHAARAGASNTLSFTVDLTKLLAGSGLSFPISTASNPQALILSLEAGVLNSAGATENEARQVFMLQREH